MSISIPSGGSVISSTERTNTQSLFLHAFGLFSAP